MERYWWKVRESPGQNPKDFSHRAIKEEESKWEIAIERGPETCWQSSVPESLGHESLSGLGDGITTRSHLGRKGGLEAWWESESLIVEVGVDACNSKHLLQTMPLKLNNWLFPSVLSGWGAPTQVCPLTSLEIFTVCPEMSKGMELLVGIESWIKWGTLTWITNRKCICNYVNTGRQWLT